MEIVVPVSLAGLPCISVPVGFGQREAVAALPMGMQLAAAHGQDAALPGVAQMWHRATDRPVRCPSPDRSAPRLIGTRLIGSCLPRPQ